ncbi:unnamed protein product [Bursaphelenchus okinawaensis]|uniref:Uncharacterized protein n=1 Tax=Bursaphelenchus okinawaensis TaxID=465554 RepID=A0A811L3U6_9BILA|nr:unnamed protein product [Bursaphelenchus okinawaensis]CAG9116808.1 unnamed protein product [Bursaphelenchus okinawaensis]
METAECSKCVDVLKNSLKRRFPYNKDLFCGKIRRIDCGDVNSTDYDKVHSWSFEDPIESDSIIMTMIGSDLFLRARTVRGQRFHKYLRLEPGWEHGQLRCVTMGLELRLLRRRAG